MELTYTQCGDYLIPNLVLSDTKEYHIGKYGRMRRAYLKDHHPALYSTLLLTEKLFPHLAEIDAACKTRLEIIEAEMMRREGVTEALKADNQMEWVRRMNSIHSRPKKLSCMNLCTQNKQQCPHSKPYKPAVRAFFVISATSSILCGRNRCAQSSQPL